MNFKDGGGRSTRLATRQGSDRLNGVRFGVSVRSDSRSGGSVKISEARLGGAGYMPVSLDKATRPLGGGSSAGWMVGKAAEAWGDSRPFRSSGCLVEALSGNTSWCAWLLETKEGQESQSVHRKDWHHNRKRAPCMRICLLL